MLLNSIVRTPIIVEDTNAFRMGLPATEEVLEKIKNPKKSIEEYFRIYDRGSTWGAEIRAGLARFPLYLVFNT